jgi:hypothetical protein
MTQLFNRSEEFGDRNIMPNDVPYYLIKLFESEDTFIKEYQRMLADRLLEAEGFNTDQEVLDELSFF